MRGGLAARFFGISIILAGLLMFALVFRNDLVDEPKPPARNVFFPRQASVSANPSPAAPASSATPAESSTQQAASSSNPPAASSTSQQEQPAQTSTTQSSAAQQPTSQTPAQTSATPTNAASAPPSTPTTTFTSAVVTTDPGGQVVTSIVVVSDTSPSSSAAPSQSSAASGSGSGGGGSGISSSTIIGLSVAGGVAVLCVVGFFVWKFTRKRLGDYDNNEEIKWPELNAHDTAVPLPTNRTGGAGFDTAADARRSSLGYAPSTAANSTAELQPDPYAVPPLPHLDPNQPYHDDPTTRFYDPYRGPVPQSFEQTGAGGGGGQAGEAIPMTQLAGRRSPGPATAYGGGGSGDFAAASIRAASPGPHAAYGSADFGGGRASPAPPPTYGADFGGRASPGPRAPYAGGRVSPGPQAAYGNVYGPR